MYQKDIVTEGVVEKIKGNYEKLMNEKYEV